MRIICIISFLFFSFNLFAKETDSLICLAKYAVDHHSNWNLENIQKQKFIKFVENENINLGYNKNATVWCAFEIENKGTHDRTIHLCFDNNHIDSLQLISDHLTEYLGDRTEFNSPYLLNQSFEIRLNAQEKKSFYIKLKKSISFFDFSFHLDEQKILKRKSHHKIVLISFLSGIITLLIFFIAILYVVTFKRLYFYYILYSFVTIIYILVNTGFAKYYIFQTYLYFSEWRIYSASLGFIGLSLFFAEFLNLRQAQSRKYWFILVLNIINLGIVFISILLLKLDALSSIKTITTVGYLIFLAIIIALLWATFAHFKIDKLKTTYILFSFLPHIVWAITFILKSFIIYKNEIHIDWLVVINIYEVVLFGCLLAKDYIETFKNNNVLTRAIIVEKENSILAIELAQARERRQISNVLHDNFGTKLAHIMQLMELKKIDDMSVNLKVLTEEIRNISHQIMPRELEEGALVSSIATEIDNLNKGTTCEINFYAFDFPENMDEIWTLNLFLTSLELINNALKHGKPKIILVEFFAYEEEYIFQFTDDGLGFDSNKIAKGFGLSTIESRINSVNGKMEISSKKGEGTVIQIIIPISG